MATQKTKRQYEMNDKIGGGARVSRIEREKEENT